MCLVFSYLPSPFYVYLFSFVIEVLICHYFGMKLSCLLANTSFIHTRVSITHSVPIIHLYNSHATILSWLQNVDWSSITREIHKFTWWVTLYCTQVSEIPIKHSHYQEPNLKVRPSRFSLHVWLYLREKCFLIYHHSYSILWASHLLSLFSLTKHDERYLMF